MEWINTNGISLSADKNYFLSQLFLLIPPSVLNDLFAIRWGCLICTLCLCLQRCFTLVDRGFTFKLISNYVNMITATDSKVKKGLQIHCIIQMHIYCTFVEVEEVSSAEQNYATVEGGEYVAGRHTDKRWSEGSRWRPQEMISLSTERDECSVISTLAK